MSDVSQWLRVIAALPGVPPGTVADAADEIERLERELSEAKKALDLTRKSISQYSGEIHWLREANSELEAQAAAMRAALYNAKGLWGHLSTDPSQRVWLETVEAALSTDAGRKVRDVIEAAKHFMCEDMASHVVDANSQPLSEAWNKLNEALAAMEK